jgi:uncharacterized protein YbjT (DUF2867 family)
MEAALRTSLRSLAKVGEALGISNLDPESGRIFITDPIHDVVGYRVVNKLLRAGYPIVRIGMTGTEISGHDSSSNDMIMQWNSHDHAEVAVFDWDREDTYLPALKDVKSVFVCLPYRTPSWYHQHFPTFIRACDQAGVRHVVKLSFYHARHCHNQHHLPTHTNIKNNDSKGNGITTNLNTLSKSEMKDSIPPATGSCVYQKVPYVHAMGECDQWLMDSISPKMEVRMMADIDIGFVDSHLSRHLSYTILSSSRYMSDPFRSQNHELRRREMKPCTMYGASHDQLVQYISPNDVAEVSVRVLLEPRAHFNCEYTLTNVPSNARTEQQIASLLSQYLQKPIMYVNQSSHEYEQELRMSGVKDYCVRDRVAWEQIKASGREGRDDYATTHFADLCGHSPQSFEEYLSNVDDMLPMEKP